MKKLALSLIVTCMGIITYSQENGSVYPIWKKSTNSESKESGSIYPIAKKYTNSDSQENGTVDLVSRKVIYPESAVPETRLVGIPHGQAIGTPQNRVEIGGIVPNIPFKLMNGTTVNLYDFKDKLVILDFWSIACRTCIAKFPEIDSLQEMYRDQLQILLVNSSLVTKDSKKQISDFFEKRRGTFGNTIERAVTVNDTVAQQTFPHYSIPHYVWITKDHRVRAITFFYDVNEANIKAVLNGESVVFPIKKDFSTDELINFPPAITDKLGVFKVFRRGKLEGLENSLNYRTEQVKKGDTIVSLNRGKIMINATLLQMYNNTLLGNQKFLAKYTDKYLILDVKDSSELVFNPATMDREEWEQQNFYYYDVIVPPKETKSIYSLILKDLNHYSGYYGRIEKRKIKCLALVTTGKLEKIKDTVQEGNPYLKYFEGDTFQDLVKTLDDRVKNTNRPILNETHYKGHINIGLSDHIKDLAVLKKELKPYNLALINVERLIEVFVISKK